MFIHLLLKHHPDSLTESVQSIVIDNSQIKHGWPSFVYHVLMIPFLRPSKYPRKLVNTCLENPQHKWSVWKVANVGEQCQKTSPSHNHFMSYVYCTASRPCMAATQTRPSYRSYIYHSQSWVVYGIVQTPGWLPNEYILGGSSHFETIQPWLKQLLASPRSALSILSLCNTWVYPNKHQ